MGDEREGRRLGGSRGVVEGDDEAGGRQGGDLVLRRAHTLRHGGIDARGGVEELYEQICRVQSVPGAGEDCGATVRGSHNWSVIIGYRQLNPPMIWHAPTATSCAMGEVLPQTVGNVIIISALLRFDKHC